jgi:hypothetical protein
MRGSLLPERSEDSGLSFDLRDETHGRGDTEVSLEENLLQRLQRSLYGAGARESRDIGERYVLYFGPQRTRGEIAGSPDYPAWHLVGARLGTKKTRTRGPGSR